MDVRILLEPAIRELVSRRAALEAVRAAFVALDAGEAILPVQSELDIPRRHGEVHVKGAYLGGPFFAYKVATGFYDNPKLGLPVASGLSLAFDAATGLLAGLLFDNGWLTEVRTGAAGALTSDVLAVEHPDQVGILGAGGQARHQLEALLDVRTPRRVVVFGRTKARAEEFQREMSDRHGIDITLVNSAREAVEGSQIVITTTPAREALVQAEWVAPGTHIVAMGSDMHDKYELDGAVLAKADRVVADSLAQCLSSGEIHHAVETGFFKPEQLYAELGAVVSGRKAGRENDEQITVADLTGVGIQDAAMAGLVMDRAQAAGAGTIIAI